MQSNADVMVMIVFMPILPFQKETVVADNVTAVRTTSQEDKDTLYKALKEYQQTLNTGIPALFDSSTSSRFTDSLIFQIVENCANIFTIKNLTDYPFFTIKHAQTVLELIQEIFEDIPDYNSTMAVFEEQTAFDGLFPSVKTDDHLFPNYFDNSDSESVDDIDCVKEDKF